MVAAEAKERELSKIQYITIREELSLLPERRPMDTTGLLFPKVKSKKKRKKHHVSIIPCNRKGVCYLCKRHTYTHEQPYLWRGKQKPIGRIWIKSPLMRGMPRNRKGSSTYLRPDKEISGKDRAAGIWAAGRQQGRVYEDIWKELFVRRVKLWETKRVQLA